jgi:hypothetical protein
MRENMFHLTTLWTAAPSLLRSQPVSFAKYLPTSRAITVPSFSSAQQHRYENLKTYKMPVAKPTQ